VVRPMLDWQTQSVPESSGYGPVSRPT
jgi:hypothetical protein